MKKELSAKQQKELLNTLKERFEQNQDRHKNIEWAKVQSRRIVRNILTLIFTSS